MLSTGFVFPVSSATCSFPSRLTSTGFELVESVKGIMYFAFVLFLNIAVQTSIYIGMIELIALRGFIICLKGLRYLKYKK